MPGFITVFALLEFTFYSVPGDPLPGEKTGVCGDNECDLHEVAWRAPGKA